MAEFSKILFQVDGPVARITLNRPEKRNALDDGLVRELKDALALAAANETVRVVLLSGAGKDFCSGADIEALSSTRNATVIELMANARNMAELFQLMRRHPRPVVAAVRGRALAGGCGLATACDVILAAESSQFGYPEVNIGFIPAMVMAILRRAVPEKRAFEMITGGELLTARSAFEIALINRVFGDDQFDEKVEAFVQSLAKRSASAVSLAKTLLYHMDGLSFDAALESGVHFNAITRMTDDCKDGVERFLKRG
jgi:methylglutaconyl-CoA hydratase